MKKYFAIALALLQIQFGYANLSQGNEKNDKIVNGDEVSPKYKYPYQAYFVAGRFKCGGTVIGRRHVLTADHCIKGETPSRNTYVIVGEHRVDSNQAYSRNPQNFFGSNVIRVAKFIKIRTGADIGILELERDIKFSSRIQPACIPPRDAGNYAGRDAVVTGWGGTIGYSQGQLVNQIGSNVLLETYLRVQSPNSRLCRKIFANRPGRLCAYRQGYDTCQGDSGGPMTVKENGRFVVIGVTSYGKGCGATGEAGGYVRVSYHHDWIQGKVNDVCTSGATEITTINTSPSPVITQRPVTASSPVTLSPATSTPDCSCSEFINQNGFGRCGKPDSDFGGEPSCYVNLPSTCPDLVRSGSNPEKYLSAQACQSGSSLDVTTPNPISGCSCTNFVNKNGYGKCLKTSLDFGGRAICYVKLPSSCGDLVKSESDPGMYLSAQPCPTRPEPQFKETEENGN